jgi:hypothetical protein
VENFNESIKISTGEYICLIGDDDSINPEIINAAEFLKLQNIDCLAVKNVVNYIWPDSFKPNKKYNDLSSSKLFISNFVGDVYLTNAIVGLENYVKNGCLNYLNYNLPKLYHGIVRKTCLDEIKNLTGSYFSGLSPDISISISLSCIIKHFFVTDYPLTIPGICGESASVVEGLIKNHSKKLDDAPHLKNTKNYQWSELVPRVYTIQTIWADSAIASMRFMKRDDLIKKISLYKLSAFTINANSGVFWPVVSGFLNGNRFFTNSGVKSFFKLFILIIYLELKSVLRNLRHKFLKFLKLDQNSHIAMIENIDNVYAASTALSDFLIKNNISFKNIQIKK